MKTLKIFVSHRIDKVSEKIKDNSFLPIFCGATFLPGGGIRRVTSMIMLEIISQQKE